MKSKIMFFLSTCIFNACHSSTSITPQPENDASENDAYSDSLEQSTSNTDSALDSGLDATTDVKTNAGPTWNSIESKSTVQLNDIWGKSSNDIWVVGEQGTILKWQNSTWVPQNSSTKSALQGVFGTSSKNIWAVGISNTTLQYDGKSWSEIKTSYTDNLYSVWALDQKDVWAVSDDGIIFKWDKTSTWFKVFQHKQKSRFNRISGSSATNVWAIGMNGMMARFNGTEWLSVSSPTMKNLFGIWAQADNNVWFTGDFSTLLHWDGKTLSVVNAGVSGPEWDFRGLWGSSVNDIWVLNKYGDSLHWDGTLWNTINLGVNNNVRMTHIWGMSSSDIWAVGSNGAILHYH